MKTRRFLKIPVACPLTASAPALVISMIIAMIMITAPSFSFAEAAPTPLASSDAPNPSQPVSDQTCGGGYDSTKVATCGFDALRAEAKGQGNANHCVSNIKSRLCSGSPWAGLNLHERVQRVADIAMKSVGSTGVDYRALPCVVRRESIWFDPMIMTFGTCSMTTTDQGLGQVVFTTFKDLVDNYHFKSKIAPFDKAPYTNDSRLLFSAMSMSVQLQMEIVSAVLKTKLSSARGDYEKAFSFYNGGKDRVEYGQMVGACYACMKSKMDLSTPAAQRNKVNVDECLDKPMKGHGVDYSYTRFVTECRGQTFNKCLYISTHGMTDTDCNGAEPIAQPGAAAPAKANH